jgi:hypothetical protein
MTNPRIGPPNENGRGPAPPGHPTITVEGLPDPTTNKPNDTAQAPRKPGTALRWVPCTWASPQAIGSQLRRRRAASQRVVPLDCGCPDPWPCRCSEPPLSDKMVDAGREAALHIWDTGRVPLLEIEVLQALWRRGGSDRDLAEQLYAATAGEIA